MNVSPDHFRRIWRGLGLGVAASGFGCHTAAASTGAGEGSVVASADPWPGAVLALFVGLFIGCLAAVVAGRVSRRPRRGSSAARLQHRSNVTGCLVGVLVDPTEGGGGAGACRHDERTVEAAG